jgi:hypothetical protein
VGERLSDADARRAVLETAAVNPWWLGRSLGRDGPALPGDVPPALLADILQLGEPENWTRTLGRGQTSEALFLPFCIAQKDDGKQYRSFLPEDLKSEDEARLRTLATASKNPIVRTRLHEVLWTRFSRHEDALAAIEARLAAAPLHDAEGDWPGLVKNLGRLTTLALAFNAKSQLGQLIQTLDKAAETLTKCSRPYAFPVLADMVCHTLLDRKAGREAFTKERGSRWSTLLAEIAERFRADSQHGHDALVVLQAWHAKWSETSDAVRVRRRVVQQLAEVAAADASKATYFLQRALQFALDHGLKDLGESMRLRLSEAIKAAIPQFQMISGQFNLPPELVAQVDRCLQEGPTLSLAIRQLATLPGLLEVDVAQLETHARQDLKSSPMRALMPAEHFHPDGKVTYRSNDFEGNVERQVGTLVGFHLVVVEALLRHFIGQALVQFEDDTLLGSLPDWPHLLPNRRALLTRASERFAKRDWVSAGFILVTVYEAVLRDLLRAGGYSALKVDPGGTQMDEPLNSLLRAEGTRRVLGAGHCDLVTYALAEPAMGWNLRNEVAHGTVHADALTPSRVLLVWLMVVRLTCFVANGGPVDQRDHAENTDGSRDRETGAGSAPAEEGLGGGDDGGPR